MAATIAHDEKAMFRRQIAPLDVVSLMRELMQTDAPTTAVVAVAKCDAPEDRGSGEPDPKTPRMVQFAELLSFSENQRARIVFQALTNRTKVSNQEAQGVASTVATW